MKIAGTEKCLFSSCTFSEVYVPCIIFTRMPGDFYSKQLRFGAAAFLVVLVTSVKCYHLPLFVESDF